VKKEVLVHAICLDKAEAFVSETSDSSLLHMQ
jgi:hypothetical protein